MVSLWEDIATDLKKGKNVEKSENNQTVETPITSTPGDYEARRWLGCQNVIGDWMGAALLVQEQAAMTRLLNRA